MFHFISSLGLQSNNLSLFPSLSLCLSLSHTNTNKFSIKVRFAIDTQAVEQLHTHKKKSFFLQRKHKHGVTNKNTCWTRNEARTGDYISLSNGMMERGRAARSHPSFLTSDVAPVDARSLRFGHADAPVSSTSRCDHNPALLYSHMLSPARWWRLRLMGDWIERVIVHRQLLPLSP